MKNDMRAAVIAAPGRIEVERVPRPEPGPEEVLVRMEGCGICASSIPVWEGRPWFGYPAEPGLPGHEGWGEVERLGEGVEGLRPGDRVTLLSYRAFAEFDVAPASCVVKLPAGLATLPFPGEAVGCAVNVVKRSAIEAGQTVAVVGIGFLGALIVRLAAAAGARVIALTRRQGPLETAREFGAAETVVMDDHQRVIDRVRELTGGRGCERVIEATGQQWPLDLAGELTCERGRLVIAGFHQDGPRQVNLQLWNWRGLDVINAHERDPQIYIRGIREAVSAAADGILDLRPLFTHVYRLEETGQGFETLVSRPEGFMKALVAL